MPKDRFDAAEAGRQPDPLSLRAYTSRLIGREPELALHGGGNTSLKLGEQGRRILYIKGSGRDLAQTRPEDLVPVDLDAALALLDHPAPGDFRRRLADLVLDPVAPAPSIETLMHAAVPAAFVEHTHPDAVLALAANRDSIHHLGQALGERVRTVPFRHSGADLAAACRQALMGAPAELEGLVLLQHGMVSFADDAEASYRRTIDLAGRAETYLRRQGAWDLPIGGAERVAADTLLALRRDLCRIAGAPLLLRRHLDGQTMGYCRRPDLAELVARGPATAQIAVFCRAWQVGTDIAAYAEAGAAWRAKHGLAGDHAPRIIVDPRIGLLAAAVSPHLLQVTADLAKHAMGIMARSEALGGYQGLAPADLAAAERDYGGFEAKLRAAKPLAGQAVLLAGGPEHASILTELQKLGAAVAGPLPGADLPLNGEMDILAEIAQGFGGLDAVVADAGHAVWLDKIRPALAYGEPRIALIGGGWDETVLARFHDMPIRLERLAAAEAIGYLVGAGCR